MGFFDEPDEDPPKADGEDSRPEIDADKRQAEDLRRIQAGGIPLEAELRLRAIGEHGGAFTSTLGVGEFALLSELGPVPLAQVLGASVHQVGWQNLPADATWGGHVYCELGQVMQAWERARQRALHRIAEEARLVGADLVLGVRLRRGEHDWARNSVDYMVSGTAVRKQRSASQGEPVISDLSVQDYWKLAQAGWAPVGLVAATAVFFVAQSTSLAWSRRLTAMRNQELQEYSEGFYNARERAMNIVRAQAITAKATGVVGVSLAHRISREEFPGDAVLCAGGRRDRSRSGGGHGRTRPVRDPRAREPQGDGDHDPRRRDGDPAGRCGRGADAGDHDAADGGPMRGARLEARTLRESPWGRFSRATGRMYQ